MTISIETAKVQHFGNGATTIFVVPFYFFDDSHLAVYTLSGSTETLLTLGADYTVTGAGVPAGGSVTLTVAPADGVVVTIARDVPVTQETDYVPNDPFPADSHEDAIDKLTMICQQLSEAMDRTLRLAISVSGVSTLLPPPESKAIIGWTEDETALRNWAAVDFATAALTQDYHVETFEGDGSTTVFALADDPGTTSNLVVFIDGVRAVPVVDYALSYSASIARISFVSPPLDEAEILAQYVRALPGSSSPGAGSVTVASLASGFVLPIANGGTAATTAAAARTSLGLGDVAWKSQPNTFSKSQQILSTSPDSNGGLTYAVSSKATYTSAATYGGATPEHGAVHAWALFGDGAVPATINNKYLTPLIGRANDNSDGSGNVLWGVVTEAIAGMWWDGATWHYPRNCTVLGGEAAAANFVGYDANTPVIVGWDVVFKNRMDVETAVRNNNGNRFNYNARGLMISSQLRGTDGKYCGWNSGIWFGGGSLDLDAGRDWCVGIAFNQACWTAGYMTRQPYLYTWQQDVTYYGVIHNTAGQWLEWRAGANGLGPTYTVTTRMQLGMADGLLRTQTGYGLVNNGETGRTLLWLTTNLGVSNLLGVSSANAVWAAAAPGATVGKLRILVDGAPYAIEVKAWS